MAMKGWPRQYETGGRRIRAGYQSRKLNSGLVLVNFENEVMLWVKRASRTRIPVPKIDENIIVARDWPLAQFLRGYTDAHISNLL
jgi:hypothetical protein